MMRSNSPITRPSCSSPAISEISVGSPSPPPSTPLANIRPHITAFRPLNVKRMRLSAAHESLRSPPPPALPVQAPQLMGLPMQLTTRHRSCVDRVKSFTIADILGKREDEASLPPAPAAFARAAAPPAVQLLSERLQAPLPATAVTAAAPTQLVIDVPAAATALTKIVHPWDPVRGPLHPLGPFLPPAALLHYEQRLAWDYQRQLQEHFQAQAHLLRQMSLDPTIIPSEDGSERSHSSMTGSEECCSPDVNVGGEPAAGDVRKRGNRSQGVEREDEHPGASADDLSAKKSASDTPLDALFQLSTKNFDEDPDPTALSIFAARPNPKKKRKSRTAFTNHQIFELEKRFLYQKYLSPADRDEIAGGLGLSNAQVITWFQNRRAKLKRDMEELKKDVESVKQLPDQSADSSSQHQNRQQSQHTTHLQRLHQQLQQFQQHFHYHAGHLPAASPMSATPLHAQLHQQQQQQQQHQQQPPKVNTATATAHALMPSSNKTPADVVIPSSVVGRMLTGTSTSSSSHNSNRATSSTAAEDKQELKMLKMMTLMYYSSQPSTDDGVLQPPPAKKLNTN